VNKYQASWRKALMHAVKLGVPTPAFSTALAFFDGYRTAAAANLLQAQRDYFGAHTYERVDQPRGQFFHTNWTGTGFSSSPSSPLSRGLSRMLSLPVSTCSLSFIVC
jgi:6-phosphogluconate dehydrogenase